MSSVHPSDRSSRAVATAVPVATRGRGSRGVVAQADAPVVGLPPAHITDAVAGMFRLLGDPTRVRLIAALAAGELTVGVLARTVGMTESAVSHQLRSLKEARMVKGRRAGRLVYYALDDLHVLTLFRQALTHAREDCHDVRSPA